MWEPDALLLLGPRTRQGLGEAGDREIRRRGAIDDRRNDAGRNEGEGCQQADVPFTLGFALGNLGEGGNSTEPDVVDPSSGLDDCGEQSIAALGLHRRFCGGRMNDALHGGEAWSCPCEQDRGGVQTSVDPHCHVYQTAARQNRGGDPREQIPMLYVAIIQVLSTAIIGTVAVVVAWRQWSTSHHRLVLDLFGRRFQVYQELARAIADAANKPNAEIADLANFDTATQTARFLFGPEVHDYLSTVRQALVLVISIGHAMAAIPVDAPQRKDAEAAMLDNLNQLNGFYGRLSEMVTPYLRLAVRS